MIEGLDTQLSLGHFYRAATVHAGLEGPAGRGAEGKLMGLAAYGIPDQRMPLEVSERGLVLADDLRAPRIAAPRKLLRRAYGAWFEQNTYPFAKGDGTDVWAFTRLAASAQQTIQRAVLLLAERAKLLTGCRHLVVAGGVGLNCSANGVLGNSGLFDAVFHHPLSHDGGVSLGAALEVASVGQGEHSGCRGRLRNPYLGPEFSDTEYHDALRASGLSFSKLEVPNLTKIVATHIVPGSL